MDTRENNREDEEKERDSRCSIVVVVSSSLSSSTPHDEGVHEEHHPHHHYHAAARHFVRRIISLSDSANKETTTAIPAITTTTVPSTSTATSTSTSISSSNQPQAAPPTKTKTTAIPHTLRNRYYEADVWFRIVAGGVEDVGRALRVSGGREVGMKGEGEGDGGFGRFEGFASASASWSGSDEEEGEEEEEGADEDPNQRGKGKGTGIHHAPAIIFLWASNGTRTDACRKEIGDLARGMRRAGWDAEVCLAVRVGGGGGGGDTVEGEGDVDGMFMEHGFEYVDARDRNRDGDGDDEREEEEDVPRLPRVLDALSTVMWANMRAKDKGKGKGKGKATLGDDEEEMLRELMDVAALRPQEDEEEEEFEFGEMVSSPVDYDIDTGFLSPFGLTGPGAGVRRKVSMGFEDDFVQFSVHPEGGYVALEHGDDGGFNDFNHPDDQDEDEDEDTDTDLPSKADIKRTAKHIFADDDLTDIDSVFTSLKDMKAEIARLESEDERRSVAARVALGVVYGLGLDVDRDRDRDMP